MNSIVEPRPTIANDSATKKTNNAMDHHRTRRRQHRISPRTIQQQRRKRLTKNRIPGAVSVRGKAYGQAPAWANQLQENNSSSSSSNDDDDSASATIVAALDVSLHQIWYDDAEDDDCDLPIAVAVEDNDNELEGEGARSCSKNNNAVVIHVIVLDQEC
eukprot:CAMPEP_0116019250 /NCGR_PEP_ID=MMETSP0321-20121206/9123_1 /TAXON_ID=163516 /ORGANISM="Leptocylindrus danicus var. danicus, Strain B650" /LENGTH=158 /DNA_ID=CAMNT_0003489781 /DNA_START=468 /DNA_END=947 /DNA_ORIENTATION=-